MAEVDIVVMSACAMHSRIIYTFCFLGVEGNKIFFSELVTNSK
jgi:hypothetical protein